LSRNSNLIVFSLFVSGVAGSAAAEDCFIKVRTTGEARAPSPPRPVASHRRTSPAHVGRRLHHLRRPGRAKPAIVAATQPQVPRQHYAESSFAQQTIPAYVLRPTSCDTQPAATLQSPPPAGPVTPSQRLLDALAGPATPPASDAAAPGRPAGGFSPAGGDLLPPGGTLPVIGSGLPGEPGGPSGEPSFPGSPPDTPPIITPPEGGLPPTEVLPPGGGQPPVIISPPGGGQPPITPPGGAIPEPSTWSLMILGALAVGGALRSRRAARPPRGAFEITRKPKN
jgi:hypothetical protein